MTKPSTDGPRSILVGSRIAGATAAVVIGAGLARGEVGPVVFTPSTDAVSGPTSRVVDIRGLRFEPLVRDVAKGDTIVWINHDLVPHTVAAADSSWSSGNIATGQSWRMVVESEDEIAYFCEYHPTMRGRIRVR